jgi:hypothetical protein
LTMATIENPEQTVARPSSALANLSLGLRCPFARSVLASRSPLAGLSLALCSAFPLANASLVRIIDAFMLTSASFTSTNASLVLVSQMTRPLSTWSFVHANDALVSTNEAFILASYLIDSQMHACCAFCQQQLSSSKQVTAHFRQNAEGRSTLSDTLGGSP